MSEASEKKPQKKKIGVKVEMDLSWIVLSLWLIAIGICNSPDKFDPRKTYCMSVSSTLYTNVGTQVLDETVNLSPAPDLKVKAYFRQKPMHAWAFVL